MNGAFSKARTLIDGEDAIMIAMVTVVCVLLIKLL
jgi:hypothetical protein